MLARLPSAACSSGSRFATQIATTRELFDVRFAATKVFQRAMVPVEIRGIAFFGFFDGEHGIAPNGIELHPVTSINFRPLSDPAPPRTRRRAAGDSPSGCRVPSLEMTTSRSSICSGEAVTLSWQASDPAARVTIDGVGAALPASGSMPAGTNVSSAYSGHATNACGSGAEAVAVVAVRTAASISLSGPASLTRGSAGSLSVFTEGATSWTLTSSLRNAISPSSGTNGGAFTSSYNAGSSGTDTVALTANGTCGSLTRTISIFVSDPVNLGLLCCDGTRSPTCFSC
ncbi:MAG TPA: hypothetical protein VN181_16965, partial [Thermoanaerobaculia bacterium]|nr:hypothetical protein [Thermoanaerobaculia bacterium]